ncbi:C2 domain-containing protein 3 [Geodia barretti]|uniref:C2 domain-containing protein 3 n=2 Tax=Geodia barretti TaxID=519541 RepID=A0AA35TDM9_GEOBA|nr:C2 domain-containing protein 3 [Geodia barretti]
MTRGGKTRGGGGRQLEATVHTSLPPRVQGPLRAYVRVCLPAIHWEYSVGPPASKLCVGMRWWGEESSGTVFRVPVVHGQRRCSSEESTTLAFFPVRSALPQLSSYLKDMKSLKLRVGLGHMTDDSMVIGRSTLPDLSTLTKSQPYEDSLPIIGTQGHRLGRLQVQIELQVARAGQTRLTTPAAASDDVSHPPEFKVGPGAHRATEKQREPIAEIDTLPPQEHRATSSRNTNRGHAEPKTYTESAASHKAALLAKYINPNTSKETATGQEQMTVSPTGSGSTTGQSVYGEMGSAVARPLGPQQQEVIAELIERGERLREAMARAVLDSGIEKKKGRERGRKRGRVPLCGVVGDVSMEESDYPLRDPSLLEKLLHSRDVETGKKTQDFGTQTHSPTTTDFPSGSKSTAQSDDLHHRPSSPPPSPSSHSSKLEAGGSLSTLASFFSGHSLQKSTDAEILQAVGVERLTLLGRVTSCRVVIDILEVDPLKMAAVLRHSGIKMAAVLVPSGKKRQYQSGPLSTSLSGTFFVEYHFPAAVSGRGGRGRKGVVFPPPHEVVRVASRKIKNKVVRFGHRSVFAVSPRWSCDQTVVARCSHLQRVLSTSYGSRLRVGWGRRGCVSSVADGWRLHLPWWLLLPPGLGAKRDEDLIELTTMRYIVKLTGVCSSVCGKGV